MIEALAKAGPNYRGVAIINDSTTDAELATLDAAGVRAARFSFASFLKIVPTIAEFERGVARVGELGWHIKVFAVGDDLLKYADAFEQVDVPMVFDHMGFLEQHRGVE